MREIDLGEIDSYYKPYIDAQLSEIGDILNGITYYSIEDLLENLDGERVTPIPGGSKSCVFRLKNIIAERDTTLKIVTNFDDEMEYFFDDGDFRELEEEEYYFDKGIHTLGLASRISAISTRGFARELAIRQILGHTIGSVRAPRYIDAPVGIWTARSQTDIVVVGYSLPFIEGEAIKIEQDEELNTLGDQLQVQGLYVGHRKHSLNAIVNTQTGEKRFIDVEVRF